MKHYANNPRKISREQFERLRDDLLRFGDLSGIVHDLNSDEIVGGNQRTRALDLTGHAPVIVQTYDTPTRTGTVAEGYYEIDGERYAYRAVRWDEATCREANIKANVDGGSWDFDVLAGWDAGDLGEWGFDAELLRTWNDDAANLALMLEAERAEEEGDGGGGDDAHESDRYALYVPDALFPSSNEWDVPDLLPGLQADFLELPLTKWGDSSRKATMRGTYHFYTEDYKFEALWKDPLDLINSQCVAIVEPNCSTNDQMPLAVGLWGIYRKRWLARYAQEFGVKVWVDLNVTGKFADLNLLGVSKGWRSYCTRGLDRTLDDLAGEYERAKVHAGAEPRFLVYGGGRATQELCKEHGWQWLPENMRVKEGKAEADYG